LHATDRTLKFLKADIMGKEGGMVHTKAYVEPLAVDQLVAGQAWLARASSDTDAVLLHYDQLGMHMDRSLTPCLNSGSYYYY
jgi:hypothetical protein